MTITDFLLARIAEDEADGNWLWGGPGRAQAECEAKRAIVAGHRIPLVRFDDGREMWSPCLRALAAIYADHPDYDQSWAV